MTEIVQGLFGVSPEQLQMQQEQALQDRALKYAALSPEARNTAAIYTGASKLGGAVGGMLGGIDPLQVQASKIASVLQGADQTTAEGLINIAQRFAEAGLPQQAQMAVAKAQEMKKAESEIASKGAEATLKLAQAGAVPSETTYRLAQAKKAGFDQLSEEQAQEAARASLKEEGTFTPAQIEGIIKNPKARESYLSYAADKTQITEANGRVLLVNKQDGKTIKDLGTVTDKSTKITVPLGDALAKVYGEAEKKTAGAEWTKAGDAYNAAVPMINKLSQMSTAMQNAYTGVGADTKLALAKGFAAFGIPVDANKLSNTEYANSVGSQLIQSIARVFPGSQSNKELEQLLKSKPNISQELPTILRLIRQVQDEMRASTLTYEQLAPLSTTDRANTNPNILQGKNYSKLTRYRALEEQANSGKPMKAADIEEAKKLQQELGVQ